MGQSLQAVRGFKDLLPADAERTASLESLARRTLELYGFRELRLPMLEQAELFVKATGETTDIVEKEMFQLEDQGGRKLALRPEGTPGVVRAYLQHHLSQQGGTTKLYYVGSMFRAERPQAGRFREFEQIGAETIGNSHPAADVESILSLKAIFDRIGLKGKTRLRINNIGCDDSPDCRPKYRQELLAFLKANAGTLCANCQRRMERNPLRVLDCKTDGPKLAAAPKLAPCAPCQEHFSQVTLMLAKADGELAALGTDPTLVRGLDYYTRTVFEFQSKDVGAQDAIAGGGRYDGLIHSMGGQKTPATGWAMGVERTLAAALAADPAGQAPKNRPAAAYVAVISASGSTNGAAECMEGARLLEELRRNGIRAEGTLFGRKLGAQLGEAERQGAARAVILGPDEVLQGMCKIKDLRNGEQKDVPLSKVIEEISRA
ncbi:MAG TPA: histidine--tRNA ligase [Elusimicrobiota bacterium]|nr:histidine--tRNA ligase [Elusimicrobiota bacterium]